MNATEPRKYEVSPHEPEPGVFSRRVDAPHLPFEARVSEADLASGAEPLFEELRKQAQQLAHYLVLRREEALRREANAGEREAAVGRRAEELDEAERSLKKKAAQVQRVHQWSQEIDARAATVHAAIDDVRRRRQQLDVRQQASLELCRRLAANLQRRRDALERYSQRRDDELKRAAAEARRLGNDTNRFRQEALEKLKGLAEAEACLTLEQDQARKSRNELRTLREGLRRRERELRDALAAAQQGRDERIAEQRRRLDERGAELEARERRLEELSAGLQAAQRETLQWRLIVEGLMQRLGKTAPVAALSLETGRLREQLAASFRRESEELEQKRAEVSALLENLNERAGSLASRRLELKQWAEIRQSQLDDRADKIAALEADLQRQLDDLETQRQQWIAERSELGRKLRTLLCQRAAGTGNGA